MVIVGPVRGGVEIDDAVVERAGLIGPAGVRHQSGCELPVNVQLLSVPYPGPAAAVLAELPVNVQLFSVQAEGPAAGSVSRVAGQRAVVERAE